jgi:hypothetical protein
MSRILLVVALFGLTACGPSFIILEINADLEIPTEANTVRIITRQEANLDNVLFDRELALEDDQSFPIEVLFEPSEHTPPGYLRQEVTARLDGVVVAQTRVKHLWEMHTTSRVKIALENVQ